MTAEPRRAQDHLRVLWRWKLLFVAVVVCIPAAIYVIVSSQPKTYESSVLLQIRTPAGSPNGVISPEAVTPPQAVLSAARLITTTGVAAAAASELGQPRSAARGLLEAVSATADTQAGFVTIAARAPNAERAADIANAFAAATESFRTGQGTRRLDLAIANVERELRRVRHADREQRRQLSEQLQRLRALQGAQDDSTQIVERATASGSAIAPRVGRTVALSGIVALLLALAAVSVAHGADPKIRDPLELEEITGQPLLSTVPRVAMGSVQTSAAREHAFQTLRACLTAFNAGIDITSVLIASPGRLDGRTTVAANLARAIAAAGKDVILVDADLRRPQLAARFDVPATAGLGGVLDGNVSLDAALVDVGIDLPLGGRLRLLPAERALSHPSERLAATQMTELLVQLSAVAEVVVIDSAPVLTASDALPIIAAVSGVVAVTRIDATHRDAVHRFERIVANAGGILLGSVVTGVATPRGRRG